MKYGLPLSTPSVQTLLPALNSAGMLYGFYEIAETTFAGTETTFTLPGGDVVPLSTVRLEPFGDRLTEYVAAMWPAGSQVSNVAPWITPELITPEQFGNFRQFHMPASTWMLREGRGLYLDALFRNLAPEIDAAAAPVPPEVEDGEQTWSASADYEALFGNCVFFQFNWMQVFKTKTENRDPLRISVIEQPAPVDGKQLLRAAVVGQPISTAAGPVYNNIRITKLVDSLEPGDYVFKMEVTDTQNLKTEVTFTLTVM